MATKRMFSVKITESDAFIDMPATSQLLYFHLNMNADDDGFVGSPKRIMRMIRSSDDDFKMLVAKRFVIIYKTGVCVIKHWLVHNTLQKDRYHETMYTEEKKQLTVKDNKVYTECIQNGNILETQIRLDKNRLDKKRKENIKDVSVYDFDLIWDKYPNKDGKKSAKRHFMATVKTKHDLNDINRSLDNYKEHLDKNDWKKPKNGSTWFNNWKDWVDWVEPDAPPEQKKEHFNFAEVKASIEAQLGKIATEAMIEKCMRGIPENAWWMVEAFLKRRYPNSDNTSYIKTETKLTREKHQ